MIKKLNKTSEKLLNYLWNEAEKNDGYFKLENNNTFMPLVVELIGYNQISLAHYGEENGDLMRDPEIVFYKKDSCFFPVFIQNDYVGSYHVAMEYVEEQGFKIVNLAEYYDIIGFFNTLWSKNIIYQQEVKFKKVRKTA
ncbi:MAG: hypothetical protein CR988_02295 [Treponema sp.]|nr:MAG: hypothetical protein CR988_02295 [Treponema sp.]